MDVDTVVIGAGVVGLAIARALSFSGREVIVLEQHLNAGQETSSRNSEVIHAGIYYPNNSLKAKLCVQGNSMLYDYCHSRDIEHNRIGKLIVATDRTQIPNLQEIYKKGISNGVTDLQIIDSGEIRDIEPNLYSKKAIYSPSTGIVNSHELILALQTDLENTDGIICFGNQVVYGEVVRDGFELNIVTRAQDTYKFSCKELVNCAGLHSQKVSHSINGIPKASIPRLYLSKGQYFALKGPSPFSRLIYPLPNNDGLGVHLTLDTQGKAKFGPDTEWVNEIDYNIDMSRIKDFYLAIRAYHPGLEDDQLLPDYAGIRPKITGPGEPAGDFQVRGPKEVGVAGFVGLYGIESPGLTASLAIGEMVTRILN